MRAILWLAAIAVCAIAGPARADEVGGDIPIDGFRPALDARGFVTVDGGEVLGAGQPSFGLVTSWARGLLDLDGAGASYRVDDVITPVLVAAVGLPRGLELAASLPFGVIAADRGPDTDGGTPGDTADDDDGRLGAQGVGDLAVHAKLRLLRRDDWAVAVAIGVTLPTATAHSWLGSGATSTGGRLIVERRQGRWRLAGNLGVRLRSGGDAIYRDDISMGIAATGATVEMGPAIPAAAAAAWALSPGRIDLIGELGAQLAVRGDYAPVEATASLRVRLAEASHFTIGAGTGLGGAAGTPETRAFAAIVFEPDLGERRRAVIEPPEPPPPDAPLPGDRDDDGLTDDLDQCPDQPEDLDDYQDEDGCPDTDNDGDRILDVDDLCADDPEDLDGDDDDDGCPERDTLVVTETGIDVFEEIYFEFDSAVIQERSHEILRKVARAILDNPSLGHLEIGGHTDDRGSATYNRKLSQRRAEAVRDFLVVEGVSGKRLTPRGYGEDHPIEKGRGEAVWAANRRVEFVVLDRP